MRGWVSGYWRMYNVLVRAMGSAAVLAGFVFILWGVLRLYQLGLQASEGTPGLVLVMVGILSAGLGGTILGTPTYRPDLGDAAWNFDPFGTKARQSQNRRRSWWTGDR